MTIWLGGLFNPEAYITATRQCVAQANSWSLEEISLEVSVTDNESKVDSSGFGIRGNLNRNSFDFRILIILVFKQVLNCKEPLAAATF